MNLYRVYHDDDWLYIEAPSMDGALANFRLYLQAEYGDQEEMIDPEQVVWVQEGGAIRWEPPEEEPRKDEL